MSRQEQIESEDPTARLLGIICKVERRRRFFPPAGGTPGSRGGGDEENRLAASPDALARAVIRAIAAGFERFETIDGLWKNLATLTKDLPTPAERLGVGVLSLLEDFEGACQDWQRDSGGRAA